MDTVVTIEIHLVALSCLPIAGDMVPIYARPGKVLSSYSTFVRHSTHPFSVGMYLKHVLNGRLYTSFKQYIVTTYTMTEIHWCSAANMS